MYVSLPVVASAPGASLRVLFRVNGAVFLRADARTAPFAEDKGKLRSSARAEIVTRLRAGDYVEVITVREGGEGAVQAEPDAAVFVAEVR